MQDCNDALVKIRLAFRHVQSELPPDGTTAAAATVTLPEGFLFGDDAGGMMTEADHEVGTDRRDPILTAAEQQ